MRLVRVFPTTPGLIPVHPYAATLKALLSAPNAPTLEALAAQSGIPSRTVYRILHHVDRSVTFDVADALLVALDAHELWHTPPLDAYLTPPPRSARLIRPLTAGQVRAREAALRRRGDRCRAPARPHAQHSRSA